MRSFQYAFRGLRLMLASQRNARIHAAATALVAGAGWGFQIPAGQWCAVILAMTVVWVAEALNTAVEFLGDATTTEFHPAIERAKDVAAGAVLLAAAGAAAAGVLVFGPHVLDLLGLLMMHGESPAR